jgi:hypothetical protein
VAVHGPDDGQELVTIAVGSDIVDAFDGPDGYVFVHDDEQLSLYR